MAFTLMDDEPLPDGLRRIAREIADLVEDAITSETMEHDAQIHTARVGLKRMRALLSLLRDEVGEEMYHHEDGTVRRLGRRLAGQRDPAAILETLTSLAEQADDTDEGRALVTFHQRLVDRHGAGNKPSVRHDNVLPFLHVEIQAMRGRIQEWPIERNRFAAIDRSLRRIYSRGRRCHRRVTMHATDKSLHEWRKEAKRLQYSIEILSRIWPRVINATHREIKGLTDDLGTDHDLALQTHMLQHHSELVESESEQLLLLGIVARHRDRLQNRALRRGGRIYSERSTDFVRRIRKYWHIWR